MDYHCFSFVCGTTHPAVPPPRPARATLAAAADAAKAPAVTPVAVAPTTGKVAERAAVAAAPKVPAVTTAAAAPKAKVEAAEDVGETFVVEAGTVKGDRLCTAMLLNEVCACVEKETGRKVSRVVKSSPVDASAPILAMRLKKCAIRSEGKGFTLTDVKALLDQLLSAAGLSGTAKSCAATADAPKTGKVETAEDVGETFVVEAGTVKGDSLCTAMLLNEVCASVEKKTGRKVSRVVKSSPVDASAPILALRLKKGAIRSEGHGFTLTDVDALLAKLLAVRP